MGSGTVFKRYELKYLITTEQRDTLLSEWLPKLTPDRYGKTTIRNLYFDTNDYLLIRRSIEKPVYKEKLRMRCYQRADEDDAVFVELKKKYKKVVYKRRVAVLQRVAREWGKTGKYPLPATQISNEIDAFFEFYKNLHPTIFLSYEREAYFSKTDPSLRITFDGNVLCRQDRLSLSEDIGGYPILPEGQLLMEIKCTGGMPLWLCETLSREKIYKTSFSKYGTAYKTLIFPKVKERI